MTAHNVPMSPVMVAQLRQREVAATKQFLRTINHGLTVQMHPQRLVMTAQHALMSVRIALMHLNALTNRHALMTVRKVKMMRLNNGLTNVRKVKTTHRNNALMTVRNVKMMRRNNGLTSVRNVQKRQVMTVRVVAKMRRNNVQNHAVKHRVIHLRNGVNRRTAHHNGANLRGAHLAIAAAAAVENVVEIDNQCVM
jgi:hypothetical protein